MLTTCQGPKVGAGVLALQAAIGSWAGRTQLFSAGPPLCAECLCFGNTTLGTATKKNSDQRAPGLFLLTLDWNPDQRIEARPGWTRVHRLVFS